MDPQKDIIAYARHENQEATSKGHISTLDQPPYKFIINNIDLKILRSFLLSQRKVCINALDVLFKIIHMILAWNLEKFDLS